MKIIVDADACPVQNIIIQIAQKYQIPVILVVDYNHCLQDDYASIITVQQGRDEADYVIFSQVAKGDLVLSQDYGVAAMVLGKGALAMDFKGFVYNNENIDGLLLTRHVHKKLRNSSGRCPNVKKRTAMDDLNFQTVLISLVNCKNI